MVLGLFPLFPLLSFSQRSLEPSSLCEIKMADSQNSRVFERPTTHLLLVLKTEGGCNGKMGEVVGGGKGGVVGGRSAMMKAAANQLQNVEELFSLRRWIVVVML